MAGLKRIQRTTKCWHCGSIAVIGRKCDACGAKISTPIADTVFEQCPECGVRKPVDVRCPWCGKK